MASGSRVFPGRAALEEPPAALHPMVARDLLCPRAHLAAACPRRVRAAERQVGWGRVPPGTMRVRGVGILGPRQSSCPDAKQTTDLGSSPNV